MKRTFLWAILFSVTAAVLAAFVLRSFDLAQDQRERTAPGTPLILPASPAKDDRIQAPSFTLTDQEGRSFDSETLRGSAWIADFIFTSCAGSCPRMSEKMALLQKRLPAAIQLVSITVDPKRDSPAVLAEYARRYGAQENRWHFLTGPADDIAEIVQKGFRLSYAEGGSPEEPVTPPLVSGPSGRSDRNPPSADETSDGVTHSSRFVLVDRSGAIRGYYDSTEPSQFERLIRDARAL